MDTIRNAEAAIAVPYQNEAVGLHPSMTNSLQNTASYAELDGISIAVQFRREVTLTAG